MKIKLVNGVELFVGFAYYPEERTTVAYIQDPVTGDEYKDYAVASNRDQFNRKVGRKLALSRALQHLFPTNYELSDGEVLRNKENRKLVWEALVNRGMKLV